MPASTDASTPVSLIITMSAICIAGLFLLWHWELGPTARKTVQYSRVRHIAASWPYFAAMCILVVFAAFFAQSLFVQCCKWIHSDFSLNNGFNQMLSQGAFDIGAIAAVLYARRFLLVMERLPRLAILAHAQPKPAKPIPLLQAILVGIGVFCIARTVFIPVAFAWDWLLDRAGAEAASQDLVQIFINETSPARIAALAFIAVVIAPVTEEAIFRGGLFGYIRTRTQRLIALIIPSFVFALVHFNLRVFPLLFIFGVILSVSYERTGRLTVPIIAHALLNLSTILTILLGLAN
ncbi:membrane protease YdiL (CAAX protease family) [Ereboglobus sp. PH5-10]|uniref:CPBP family intramembrane glutamic endopeptidase n=1 Tax=Ereboglobus sp. PH5-10 TaxID=2940629 RepID=UPI002406D889|nr:type II CAAX endopeptidase family protein [Ereboglobus sp. PH5-10]MDF9827544.1 membrane protease YdiL (CAAX protease family) [Ereboglobus sp. PH5-10]